MARDEALLNITELAARLRITTRTVRRWAHAGTIPAFGPPRGLLRFRWSDVLKALRRAPAADAEATGSRRAMTACHQKENPPGRVARASSGSERPAGSAPKSTRRSTRTGRPAA